MAIYYPAVAVRLTIRFDEALLTGSQVPAPTTPQANAAAGAIAGATKAAGGGPSPGAPPAMLEGTKDRLSHSLVIVPKTASFELPSYRQAPKFNMTFNFRDFPVDPRAIRALSAEIFVGVVTGDAFARGMANETETVLNAGKLSSGARLASQLVLNYDNLMLVGVCDNLTVTHNEKGSEVMMDGRGLQGMLLDAKIHADVLKSLNLNQGVDELVRQILGMDALSAGIPVATLDSDWAKPGTIGPVQLPKPSAPELIDRMAKGQDGKKNNLPLKSDPNSIAVWDIITRFCDVCGALPYFIGNTLWIRPVKSIFDQKNAGLLGKGNTPFKGGLKRTIEIGTTKLPASYRKMIYGRNLLTFKLERKFGGAKVPTVQCISIDNSKEPNKRLIVGEWPPKDQQSKTAGAVAATGSASRNEPMRIPVPGIVDVTRLTSVARSIYNEVGRGELGGSGSTKDLASLGGDNEDADIIRLRPGDAIEFAVDASGLESFPPVISELNQQAAADPKALSQSIQDRLGFTADLADVLVGTVRGKFAGLQDVFRVANVKYAWNLDSGIAVDFDFQNYVTSRYDFDDKNSGGELDDVTTPNKFGAPSIV